MPVRSGRSCGSASAPPMVPMSCWLKVCVESTENHAESEKGQIIKGPPRGPNYILCLTVDVIVFLSFGNMWCTPFAVYIQFGSIHSIWMVSLFDLHPIRNTCRSIAMAEESKHH